MPEIETQQSDLGARLPGIVVRGRWWILLSALAVALLAVGIVYQLPNRYTSEATLLVVQQQVSQRYVTPTTMTDVSDALDAMTQEVLSRSRMLELIEQFDLYSQERRHLAPEQLIGLMRKYIDIEPIEAAPGKKDFNAFKITFTADKAILAQEVASRLTSLFIQANLKTREDQATNTAHFLQEHLDTAKQKLADQEQRLREFKTQYLGELPEQLQGNLAILSGAQLQLQNISASLERAEQQKAYLDSLLNGYRRLAARGAAVPGARASDAGRTLSPLQIAENDLDRLQAQQRQLVATFRPNYPDVIAIERAITVQKARVESLKTAAGPKTDSAEPEQTSEVKTEVKTEESEDDSSIAQLRSQLEANTLELATLTKDQTQQKALISQYQSRLNLTPVREEQLAGLLRDYELSKKDYADLLDKEQQSQLAMSLEKQQGGQQFRLVEPPSLPTLPSSPQRLKISAGAAGGGLLLGFALAFLMDIRNPSLRTEKEAAARFSLPLVVALPLLRSDSQTRGRKWRHVFEWFAGSAALLVILASQAYVYLHP